MTVISGSLWLGILIEIILLIALSSNTYFIFTVGKIRKDAFNSKGKSKLLLWFSSFLIILAMVLVFYACIKSSYYSF